MSTHRVLHLLCSATLIQPLLTWSCKWPSSSPQPSETLQMSPLHSNLHAPPPAGDAAIQLRAPLCTLPKGSSSRALFGDHSSPAASGPPQSFNAFSPIWSCCPYSNLRPSVRMQIAPSLQMAPPPNANFSALN
ncbi:hypothetical protein GOP47_0010851 [Adiantum capillus-veneris]|uniref:Secreted protein n=1 Tax=Adiantum capillus-veneris TaxID=13818 RepID=A0A9D4ZJ71_ADICA|nr:hypothetical protein GOP47_0010851 [Adiantum capillus-veneris]